MEKIFEKLWRISKRPYVKDVRFGLVAVDAMGAARHFCGFSGMMITSEDWDNLEHELRTDEAFGLVGEYFTLERAPQEVLDCYRRELGGEQEFVESVKFGLIILDEAGHMLHFCGYANEPTKEDREHLRSELKTDKSFGLTEKDNLVILDASQEQINFYKGKLEDFHYG